MGADCLAEVNLKEATRCKDSVRECRINRRRTRWWMVAAFCSALALAGIVLAIAGEQEGGIRAALRLAAPLSYALF
jgi:hypothetical protein